MQYVLQLGIYSYLMLDTTVHLCVRVCVTIASKADVHWPALAVLAPSFFWKAM